MALIQLPDEIYRLIYSYIYDVTPIRELRRKYVKNDTEYYRYRFEERVLLRNGWYHWTTYCAVFPSIVSAYWFDTGKTNEYDYDYE